jgi:hypothetical protein
MIILPSSELAANRICQKPGKQVGANKSPQSGTLLAWLWYSPPWKPYIRFRRHCAKFCHDADEVPMDPKLPAAQLILELLASSRLTKDDVLLKQAAELARAPLSTVPSRDSIRDEVFSAIGALQKVLQNAELIKQWHEHAISLAETSIASRS